MNRVFKKRVEQDYHTADVIHTDGKVFLTGEESSMSSMRTETQNR